MSETGPVLALGASNAVGRFLIDRSADHDIRLLAVSRQAPDHSWPHVTWFEHDLQSGPVAADAGVLVSVGPIEFAPAQVRAMPRVGRVIALSSVSPLFKQDSPDPVERRKMQAVSQAEQDLEAACRERDIVLTILKSTLIYGGLADPAIERMAALAGRLPVVPVAGRGRRHPVHADDLARLIWQCLVLGRASAGSWMLGGGETLDYADMVRRVVAGRDRPRPVLRLPVWLMTCLLRLAHLVGRLGDISVPMIRRQAMDLVVDDRPAREQLGWQPRPFRPERHR